MYKTYVGIIVLNITAKFKNEKSNRSELIGCIYIGLWDALILCSKTLIFLDFGYDWWYFMLILFKFLHGKNYWSLSTIRQVTKVLFLRYKSFLLKFNHFNYRLVVNRDAKKHVFFKPCFLCKKKVFFIEKNSFLMFFFCFFQLQEDF